VRFSYIGLLALQPGWTRFAPDSLINPPLKLRKVDGPHLCRNSVRLNRVELLAGRFPRCGLARAPAAPRTLRSSRGVRLAVRAHPDRWFRGTSARDRLLRGGCGSLRLHPTPGARQRAERTLAARCGNAPLRPSRPSKWFRPGRTTNGAPKNQIGSRLNRAVSPSLPRTWCGRPF
jgi:hypothetical protein